MAFVAFAILVGLQALTDRRLHATMLALAPSLLLAAWYVLGKGNSQAPPLDGRVELPKQQVTENRWTTSD
jgi:hypothetical protein